MTAKIYHYRDALEMSTEVIRCTAQEQGQYQIILSATLFHPKGGGQPADSGLIGDARVLDVFQQLDAVIHITDRAVEPGVVAISVDSAVRQQHTRYHSAGHLIAYAGEKYGWYGYKGNHKPGEGRIVFRAGDHPAAVVAEDIAREANSLVVDNLPRLLSDVEGKRQVSWGDLPHYACGGTHVLQTRDIGEIIITRVKEKKGELSVQYQLES